MKKQKLHHAVKFGTDGWRGIIADDFTFDNVGIVAQAVADYIKQVEGGRWKKRPFLQPSTSHLLPLSAAVVGYDNRFLSEKFASHVAKVFSANGIATVISRTAATSPSVSLFCKKNNCFGIMLTASHNPPSWNGLKVKLPYGGAVSEKIIKEISKFLNKSEVKIDNNDIKTADIISDYKKYLKSFVKLNLKRNLKIVVDSMYGSGSGIFESIIDGKNQITTLHNHREPLFNGINPEPIEKNLTELKKAVLDNKASVGFAFDGDADRLGVIDDKGRYLTPHIVFPLLLLYLVEGKKLKGKVVQAISLGYLSERIAKKFGLIFEEVPVGFKYICEKMLEDDVLIGGEESGGYGVNGSIPERDGILNAILLVEMLSKTNKKLSELVDDLQKKFGKSYYLRRDIKLTRPVDKQSFTKNLEKKIRSAKIGQQFAFSINDIKTYDGIKIIFEDESWLLLRPSGTEPVIRTYSETASSTRTKKLLDCAVNLVSEQRGARMEDGGWRMEDGGEKSHK